MTCFTSNDHLFLNEGFSSQHSISLAGALEYHGRPTEFLLLKQIASSSEPVTFACTVTADATMSEYILAYYTYLNESPPPTLPPLIACHQECLQTLTNYIYPSSTFNTTPEQIALQWIGSMSPVAHSRLEKRSLIQYTDGSAELLLIHDHNTNESTSIVLDGHVIRRVALLEGIGVFTVWSQSSNTTFVHVASTLDPSRYTISMSHAFTSAVATLAAAVYVVVVVCADGSVWRYWDQQCTQWFTLGNTVPENTELTYLEFLDLFILTLPGTGIRLLDPRRNRHATYSHASITSYLSIHAGRNHLRLKTSATTARDLVFSNAVDNLGVVSNTLASNAYTSWSASNDVFVAIGEEVSEFPYVVESSSTLTRNVYLGAVPLTVPFIFHAQKIYRNNTIVHQPQGTLEATSLPYHTAGDPLMVMRSSVSGNTTGEGVYVLASPVQYISVSNIRGVAYARGSYFVAIPGAVFRVPTSFEYWSDREVITVLGTIVGIASDTHTVALATTTTILRLVDYNVFTVTPDLPLFPSTVRAFQWNPSASAWSIAFNNGEVWVSETLLLWSRMFPCGRNGRIRSFVCLTTTHWIAADDASGRLFQSLDRGQRWAELKFPTRHVGRALDVQLYSNTQISVAFEGHKVCWYYATDGAWQQGFTFQHNIERSSKVLLSRTLHCKRYERASIAHADTERLWSLQEQTQLGFCLIPRSALAYQQPSLDKLGSHPRYSTHGCDREVDVNRYTRDGVASYPSIVYRINPYTFQLRFPSISNALFTVRFFDTTGLDTPPTLLRIAPHSYFDVDVSVANMIRWSDTGMYALEDVVHKCSDKSYNDIVMQYEIEYTSLNGYIQSAEYKLYIRQRSCIMNHEVYLTLPFAMNQVVWRTHKNRSIQRVQSGVHNIAQNQRVLIVKNKDVFDGPLNRFVNVYGAVGENETMHALFFDFNDSAPILVNSSTIDWYRVWSPSIEIWKMSSRRYTADEGTRVYKNLPQLIRVPWRTEFRTPSSSYSISNVYPQFESVFAVNYNYQHRWYTYMNMACADVRIPYVPWTYGYRVEEDTTLATEDGKRVFITTYQNNDVNTVDNTARIQRAVAVHGGVTSEMAVTTNTVAGTTTISGAGVTGAYGAHGYARTKLPFRRID